MKIILATANVSQNMSGTEICSSSSTSRAQPQRCPCCVFLPDDIFLPSPDVDVRTIKDEEILSPRDAYSRLVQFNNNRVGQATIQLVDTHCHAHMEGEQQDHYNIDSSTPDATSSSQTTKIPVFSLTCAVDEADWRRALDFASTSTNILPGLGIHPWYVSDLSVEWLQDLESLLRKHPSAFVGEIGLCRMARFVRTHPEGKSVALQIQRDVFAAQMRLAAKLRRRVSVHCVKQHGVFLSVLQELAESGNLTTLTLPPSIGMHSFNGTANQVMELLDFEKSQRLDAPLFYFGFSHAINYVMCTSKKAQQQGRAAVRAVPPERLVAESDVHASGDVAAGTAGALAYLAWALEKPIEDMAMQCAYNGIAYLQRNQLG